MKRPQKFCGKQFVGCIAANIRTQGFYKLLALDIKFELIFNMERFSAYVSKLIY